MIILLRRTLIFWHCAAQAVLLHVFLVFQFIELAGVILTVSALQAVALINCL